MMALLSHWRTCIQASTHIPHASSNITIGHNTTQPQPALSYVAHRRCCIYSDYLSLSTLSRNTASLQRYCTNRQITYAAIDGPHSRARTHRPSTASQLLFPHRVPEPPPALKVANPERTDMRFASLRVQVRTHYQYLGHTLSAYVHMHTLIWPHAFIGR